MKLGADQLQVVVEADAGGEHVVLGHHEQRHHLGEPFEQHLRGPVHGEQADPRHVVGGAAVREGRALQAVPEDFVQRELAYADAGEAGVAHIEAQPHTASGAVEPVGPVLVDVDAFDGEFVRRVGADEFAHPGLELGGGGTDRTRGLGGVEGFLAGAQCAFGAGVPRDAEPVEFGAGDVAAVFDVVVGPTGRRAALRRADVRVEAGPFAEVGAEVGAVGGEARRDVGFGGRGDFGGQRGQRVVDLQPVGRCGDFGTPGLRVAVELDDSRAAALDLQPVPGTDHLLQRVTRLHGRPPNAG